MPTIGGNYCAVGEFPPPGEGHGADVDAAAQPGAAAAQHHDPGPRRPEGDARRTSPRGSRAGGSRDRDDVLVYETEPLAEPVEVTGRGDVQLRVAS